MLNSTSIPYKSINLSNFLTKLRPLARPQLYIWRCYTGWPVCWSGADRRCRRRRRRSSHSFQSSSVIRRARNLFLVRAKISQGRDKQLRWWTMARTRALHLLHSSIRDISQKLSRRDECNKDTCRKARKKDESNSRSQQEDANLKKSTRYKSARAVLWAFDSKLIERTRMAPRYGRQWRKLPTSATFDAGERSSLPSRLLLTEGISENSRFCIDFGTVHEKLQRCWERIETILPSITDRGQWGITWFYNLRRLPNIDPYYLQLFSTQRW